MRRVVHAGREHLIRCCRLGPGQFRGPGHLEPGRRERRGHGGRQRQRVSVLTSAEVASITHGVVEIAEPTHEDGISVCAYALSNSAFEVEVAPSASAIGWAGFSTLVSSQAKPAGPAASVSGLGQQAISSSAGLAVQGAKYDYLVLSQKGQAASQLSNEVAMAKVLLRALG